MCSAVYICAIECCHFISSYYNLRLLWFYWINMFHVICFGLKACQVNWMLEFLFFVFEAAVPTRKESSTLQCSMRWKWKSIFKAHYWLGESSTVALKDKHISTLKFHFECFFFWREIDDSDSWKTVRDVPVNSFSINTIPTCGSEYTLFRTQQMCPMHAATHPPLLWFAWLSHHRG